MKMSITSLMKVMKQLISACPSMTIPTKSSSYVDYSVDYESFEDASYKDYSYDSSEYENTNIEDSSKKDYSYSSFLL